MRAKREATQKAKMAKFGIIQRRRSIVEDLMLRRTLKLPIARPPAKAPPKAP